MRLRFVVTVGTHQGGAVLCSYKLSPKRRKLVEKVLDIVDILTPRCFSAAGNSVLTQIGD
jgi:hypothetical protein